MRCLGGSEEIHTPFTRPVLTVGNFDGIHVGHRAILQTVVERSRAHDGEAVVYTFDPHPRRVLQPDRAPGLLTSLEQKLELMEKAGVDAVIVEPFNQSFAKTPPEAFIREILHARIRPLEVYVGYDFHFGRDRIGSMRMLTEIGPKLDFSVTIIPEITVGGKDVNSTRIRELLSQGNPEQVFELLGRYYSIRGTVVEGDRRGRTLGFPTANVRAEEPDQVLPESGVYAGTFRFLDAGEPEKGAEYLAVANVGTRPTVDRSGLVSVEAHLIDFDGDVYGRRIEVAFRHHLRAERKFQNVDALKKQIREDVALGRDRLEAS